MQPREWAPRCIPCTTRSSSERSAGKALKEIADALKLDFREIAETDRAGKTSAGKPAIEHADGAKVLEAVFSGSPGLEAEAAELGDGGYAWFDVLGITPEKQKAFEEVKARGAATSTSIWRSATRSAR